jgi:hypothetical protein
MLICKMKKCSACSRLNQELQASIHTKGAMLAAQMQRKRKNQYLILPGSNFLGTIARFTAGRVDLVFQVFLPEEWFLQ